MGFFIGSLRDLKTPFLKTTPSSTCLYTATSTGRFISRSITDADIKSWKTPVSVVIPAGDARRNPVIATVAGFLSVMACEC